MKPLLPTAWLACCALALPAPMNAAAAETCRATSSTTPPRVVELFTSEGCSSCPPADRWLSALKGREGVLPLAFHVNYWDGLGWPDRFASREGTQRQQDLSRRDGAGVYTPQVRVDGRDWRDWPRLPEGKPAAPAPGVTLERRGEAVMATVAASPGAPRLAGYWAVLEDGHESRVRAGENAGATLRHDHVVRLYRPVPAWDGTAGTTLQLSVSSGVPEHPRRVVFVLTDVSGTRPLQAAVLGC